MMLEKGGVAKSVSVSSFVFPKRLLSKKIKFYYLFTFYENGKVIPEWSIFRSSSISFMEDETGESA